MAAESLAESPPNEVRGEAEDAASLQLETSFHASWPGYKCTFQRAGSLQELRLYVLESPCRETMPAAWWVNCCHWDIGRFCETSLQGPRHRDCQGPFGVQLRRAYFVSCAYSTYHKNMYLLNSSRISCRKIRKTNIKRKIKLLHQDTIMV